MKKQGNRALIDVFKILLLLETELRCCIESGSPDFEYLLHHCATLRKLIDLHHNLMRRVICT